MRFESKRDGWILAVAILVPVLALAVISTQWYLSRRDVRGPLAGAVIVVLAIIVFVGWLFRTTYYVIEGDVLVIRSAFLTWRIPIRDITAVTPTRNPLSSPALSLDRLRIDYGTRFILVSPAERQRFVDALHAVNPAIMRAA